MSSGHFFIYCTCIYIYIYMLLYIFEYQKISMFDSANKDDQTKILKL